MPDESKLTQEERKEIRRQAQAAAGIRKVREDANGVRCMFCPGTSFRRSKLRAVDFFQMLFLRYPVRCLLCSQRQYASFAVAGLSVPSSVRHSRAPRPQETWKSWTSGTSDDPSIVTAHPPSYRPFTTAKLAQIQTSKKKTAKPAAAPKKTGTEDDAIW